MAALHTSYVRLLLGLLLASGAGCGSVLAQTLPSDVPSADTSGAPWHVTLPPLTVTASHVPTSPAQAPARITVLDSSAIHETGASSVAELLEDRAGLHVRRYGEGGLATPALRGSGASQTTLLLDGQSLTNPQLGHLDLSVLPTVLLRSVEVMHGPASPVHGSGGLGGAIQLHTLQPRAPLQARATAEVGAFGTRGGSLLLGGAPTGSTSVLAAAEYRTADGDFPYTDEALAGGPSVRRRNADRTRRTLYGTIRSRRAGHRLQVSGWWTRAERGLPPPSSAAPARERQWDTNLRIWARDRVAVGRGALSVRGMTQHVRVRYVNPTQQVDQTGRTWRHAFKTTLRTPLTSQWTTVGGVSVSHARARHPQLGERPHQEHVAAFAEGTGQYGRLLIYPAVRIDSYWMPNGAFRRAVSPRLGVNLQPVPHWSDLRLKAQVGRAFRVPTFNDRYWQPGGNADLQPERSWGGDLGLRIDRSGGHAELTAFAHLRDDEIVWQPTGNGYWAPKNIGRVRTLGAEASASWQWTLPSDVGLGTGLTYTLTDARNRSDPGSASYNEPLRYVPRNQLKGHARLSWGPATLGLTARYTGRRYVTSDGAQFLDPYGLVDAQLRLSHDFGGVRTELSLQLDNAFDVDYRSVGGRPMPPRHASIRLLVAP